MTLDVLLRSGAASAIWSSLYSTTEFGCSSALSTANYASGNVCAKETGGTLGGLTWSTCLGMLLSLSTAPANNLA